MLTFCSVMPVEKRTRCKHRLVQKRQAWNDGPIARPQNQRPHFFLTWDISEGFGDTGVLVVDDAWSFALDTSTIPHLTLTGSHALGGVYLMQKIEPY